MKRKNMTVYKEMEKKYKLRKSNPKVDLSNVIDFSKPEKWIEAKAIRRVDAYYQVGKHRRAPIYALCDTETTKHGGCFFIPQALDVSTQFEFAQRALEEFIEPPHETNLKVHCSPEKLKHIWKTAAKGDIVKDPVLSKLRWSAMGYQYDWTRREYPENPGSEIPADLAVLAQKLAGTVGYRIKSEAAIVNFYHSDSMMGGHQDDVESTFDAPVVSLSIGNTAIFLKGGTDKQQQPVACLVRSGDVLIMGRESRLSFHGVPRIICDSTPEDLKKGQDATENENLVRRYLKYTRININVRQVHAEDSCTEIEKSVLEP